MEEAISEMIRVTKNKGGIIFDLQNENHKDHIKAMKKRIWHRDHPIYSLPIRYIRNIVKILLRPVKYYLTDWSFKTIIYEPPYDIISIYSIIKNKVTSINIFGTSLENNQYLKEISISGINNYERIVIKIIK